MAFYRFLVVYVVSVVLLLNVVHSRREIDSILGDLSLDKSVDFKLLEVTFPNSIKVEFNETLNLADVKLQPKIGLEHHKCDLGYHTLVMVDPDAPSRTNPIAAVSILYLFILFLCNKILSFIRKILN